MVCFRDNEGGWIMEVEEEDESESESESESEDPRNY